jgi:tRNA(Arg) A34 adenosine deaminase TadA
MLTETRINKYFGLAAHACAMSDFVGTKRVKMGWNTSKTSVLQAEYNGLRGFDPHDNVRNTWHSEMLCLHRARNLNIDWSKASLFTFRQKCDGTPGIAKPCAACSAYIRECGIKNIYYTTNEGWVHEHIEY